MRCGKKICLCGGAAGCKEEGSVTKTDLVIVFETSGLGDEDPIDICAVSAAVIAQNEDVIVNGRKRRMVARDLLVGGNDPIGFVSA